MVRVINFSDGASVAPELVSETLLNAFLAIFSVTAKIGFDFVMLDPAEVMDFMKASDSIATSDNEVPDEAAEDLSQYMSRMMEALADENFLYEFDAFGEFILNEVVKAAVKITDIGRPFYPMSGTWKQRTDLFYECLAMARECIPEGPDDGLSQFEYAVSFSNALISLPDLVRETGSTGMYIFKNSETIDNWDATTTSVPKFETPRKRAVTLLTSTGFIE